MSILLNPRTWIYIAAALALVLYGAFSYRAGKASVRAEFDSYKIAQQESRILADRAQRTEEARRQDAITKEAEDAQKQTNVVEPDIRRSSDSASGLRSAAADTALRSSKDSCASTASQSKPDSQALDLLAQLLGRSGERTAELGAYADRLAIAGSACERSFDALRASQR